MSPSFPSMERLERFEEVAVPELEELAPVPSEWVLDVTPPTRNAATDALDDAHMRAAAPYIEQRAAGAIPDANVRCTTEAFARSVARNEELSPHLRTWIDARCGAEWGRSSTMYFTSTAAMDPRDLEQAISQVQPPQRERRTDAASPLRWAVAEAEHDGRYVYAVAFMQPRLQLEPVPMVPDTDGIVTIVGRVPAQVESLAAGVTQGRFGAAECLLDDEVELPDFRILCPTEQEDDQAWISISVRERGRLLGESTATFFVSPDGSLPLDMRLDREAVSGMIEADSIDEASAVAAVNVLRQRLDLKPLRLDDSQSRAIARVKGAYWTAWSEDDRDTMDVITMGVMAGWHIEEPIIDGRFSSNALAIPEDLTTMVALDLMRPTFRLHALDPDMDIAAFAFNQLGGNLLKLTAYYASLEDADHVAATQEVNALLDARRAAAGQDPAPRMAQDVQRMLLRHAENVHVRERNPNLQLTAVLEHLSPRYHNLRGWIISSQSLDEVRFPAAFIWGNGYEVALSTAAWRGRRDAWSAWVTMVAVDNLPSRVSAEALHDAFIAEGWVPVYSEHGSQGASLIDIAESTLEVPEPTIGGSPASPIPARVGIMY